MRRVSSNLARQSSFTNLNGTSRASVEERVLNHMQRALNGDGEKKLPGSAKLLLWLVRGVLKLGGDPGLESRLREVVPSRKL